MGKARPKPRHRPIPAVQPLTHLSPTTQVAPTCVCCVHLRRDAPGLTCDAFPAGIPDAILSNQVDHHEAVDGDQGIRFAPADRTAEHDAQVFLRAAGLLPRTEGKKPVR